MKKRFSKLTLLIGVFLTLIVVSSAYSDSGQTAGESFYFVQLSDTHWGFSGTNINPDSKGTLIKAVNDVNGLSIKPDFIVFTGDLTHTTDDPKERRRRMSEFKDIISGLNVKDIRFLPGEHDAALDNAEAYKEFFGETFYTFDHKGVHFVALDNVSDPTSSIGEKQLDWFADVLSKFDKDSRIVILTHRPLISIKPDWDWWTRDGDKALELLKPFKNVIVLYGHIHQENSQTVGGVVNYAAKGLMYPLPAPGSVPKKAPVPWDPDKPYNGLGFRVIEVTTDEPYFTITEYPVVEPMASQDDTQVIKLTAKKFEFSPNEIHVKKG